MRSERQGLGSSPSGVRIEFELEQLGHRKWNQGSRIRGDPQGIMSQSVVKG